MENLNEIEKAFVAEDNRLQELPSTETYGNPFTICTNGARWLQKTFFPSAKVVGYSIDKNPTALIGQDIYGHDFLLIDGRYILDFWYKWIVFEQSAPVFLDLEKDREQVLKYYGEPDKWEEL